MYAISTASLGLLFSDQDYIDQVIDQMTRSSISQDVVMNLVSMENYPALTTFVSSLQAPLRVIATVIAALFFLLALVDLGMSERFNLETFTKFLSKLVVAVFLIQNSNYLVTFGNAIGDWAGEEILQYVNGSGSFGENSNESFRTALTNMFASHPELIPETDWGKLVSLMSFYIYGAISLIAVAFLLTILISRLLELAIRGACMPLALSFATEEGWRGSAIRYVKKYAALCLQGPVIVVINMLGQWIMINLMANFANELVLCTIFSIAINIAVVGASKQSIQVMNDVMGV